MSDQDAGAAHQAWIDKVAEDPIDPDLPICDPHHHLWLDEGHTGWPYTLDDLHRDTGSGHRVVRTVFLECHAEYRTEGPRHLRPVGETEFVVELAEQSAASGGAEIAAIMGNADVSLGAAVEEVLAAHDEAGRQHMRPVEGFELGCEAVAPRAHRIGHVDELPLHAITVPALADGCEASAPESCYIRPVQQEGGGWVVESLPSPRATVPIRR